MKKINVLETEKFDITHKILKILSDLESRHILFSIINKSKSVQEIAKELKIPLSSAYKKIQSLQENALISDELTFTKNRRRARLYQSRIIDVKISIFKFEPTITLKKNLKNRYE
ncbi:hypothetical protein [Nitrosopumilus sp.]|uniref:hypothetical protein n=1 Tax=Nitrosopumilus sp. TaxID=2024843 RepID=UPI00247C0309|nr:hypothetical protein [Nitrosopumilus sp.]MCV0431492.1 hypothetical protein [Nitrosopumilus sp.]